MIAILKILRSYWPAILVVIIVIGAAFGIHIFGNHMYEAGRYSYKAEVEAKNAALTQALQEEKDREEAKYRGAVLARQAVEKTLSERDTRINGLLQQLRTKHTQNTKTVSRVDGTGADWIGLFGECYADYQQVGKDAARLADKVNGLQGYINSLSVLK